MLIKMHKIEQEEQRLHRIQESTARCILLYNWFVLQ